ncbi:MerR family transcriptional regulator [uncultured Mycolicibacterium sp.]|uniref:MerR family transcriptional regulator n=1 Tax=uncultured Mycolicibacterium sp. TaxID=2320817 RepID=UPI00260F2795|nr:MerR family transcriptional regulator [uncultured Mycolicibacterium sp.]
MTEFRLEDLARLSGVSARNIRAYRERGLLDPPRRRGRAAFYDERHLTQLQTIDRLLRRGFTSAHIAEFFAAARAGRDLVEVLDLGPIAAGVGGSGPATPLDIDPNGPEAIRLERAGLAARTVDGVVLLDAALAEQVCRADDQTACLRVVLTAVEAAAAAVDELITTVDAAARAADLEPTTVRALAARMLTRRLRG